MLDRRQRVLPKLSSGCGCWRRLSQNKRFWDDKALAEERIAGIEDDRRLIDSLTDLGRRIDTLDDLAHDAYFSRDFGATRDLNTERIDVAAALAKEETQHSRSRLEPDRRRIAVSIRRK